MSGRVGDVDGKVGRALALWGSGHVEEQGIANYDYNDRFGLVAWIKPESSDGVILSRSQSFDPRDENAGKGLTLVLENGRLKLKLIGRMDDWIIVSTRKRIPLHRWSHVTATFDGSRLASGIKLLVDGVEADTVAELDYSNGGIKTKEPFRIGAGADESSRFVGAIDEALVYDRELTTDEAEILAVAQNLNEIARISAESRTRGQRLKLERAFVDTFGPAEVQSVWVDLHELKRERETLAREVATVMIMAEMDPPRETFILDRGAYDKPGEKVLPGVLSVLPPLPESAPNDRLALARWLVDPANPLTARVTVNRLWQMLFGSGLVPDAGKPGNARGEANPPRPVGLAGRRVCRERLGCQVAAEDDRDECDVPPGIEGGRWPPCARIRRTGSCLEDPDSGCQPKRCATRPCCLPGCCANVSEGPR